MVMELLSIQKRDCLCMTGLMCVMLFCAYVCDGTCACWYIYLCFVMLCYVMLCVYVYMYGTWDQGLNEYKPGVHLRKETIEWCA